MEADGDKVKVATPVFPPTPVTVVDNTTPTPVTFVDNTAPTPVTVVDNTAPTPVTFVDNTTPTPVIYVNSYDSAASTSSQPLPQKGAVKLSIKSDKTAGKPLQIAVGISVESASFIGSDIDSVDLLISFDFSSLKNQTDSTTVDSNAGAESNNPLIVPIGGGKINPGDAAADGGRISSGGGGQTH
ncbi:hypothetical protein M8C21_002725 [Ambrosia artemisiifolia]|uniref:Uncharacterized protein n=1 Tax=Ambrosia artemisiifolia TaxID=4212 RepID=A0AAD5CRQ7_AMBAR|nr:hypothetical protein M8C21_002725 [Ambrosia artemisiifolia]